jgi:hypothetical protein
MIPPHDLGHYRVSDAIGIAWNSEGTLARLHVPTDDQKAIILSMKAELLERLRQDIVHALQHRPVSNRRRKLDIQP